MNIFPQIITNGIISGAEYGLIALGFSFIYSTAKFFDLSYGGVVALGGYFTFLFYRIAGIPLVFSIVLSILSCGVFGLFLYKIIYKPLRKRKASKLVYLVASLGLLTVIQALISIIFTSQFHTIILNNWKPLTIMSVTITPVQLTGVCILILLVAVMTLFLKYTRIGKAIRAVADDEEVSSIVGINTEKIMSIVFFIGSMLGAIGGIIVSLDTGIEPDMGFSLLLKGVIAAIIGGVGDIYGALVGGIMLGLIENIGIWHLAAEWKDIISFTVLIIFLIYRPQGIFKK